MTARGFWALAAESRNTRPGLFSKIGNSRRRARGSNAILLLQGREPPPDARQQMLAQRRCLDERYRVADKGFDQYPARLGFGNAAGAQIEERIRVEIADGGAVA